MRAEEGVQSQKTPQRHHAFMAPRASHSFGRLLRWPTRLGQEYSHSDPTNYVKETILRASVAIKCRKMPCVYYRNFDYAKESDFYRLL